ncbi:MAG: TolC family protein [Bacteroidota bacterium]
MHKIKPSFILFLLFITVNCYAQSPVLEQYIRESIENHPSLKQQNFAIQKSLYALEEAKGLFLPTVNFNTTYSTAAGGRKISFPVGDLVNPIYSTLNKLTPAGSPKFPEGAIPNVNEQLVPKNFYDMRLKTQMPIFNAEIKYNQKIKKQLINVQQAEMEVFKRELVKDLKTGYFNYLKSLEAIHIYENAQTLLKETERVNRSLIKNEMALPMALIRTQNEQSKIEADAILAENNRKNAQAYFNYLRNQPFETEILIDTTFRTSLSKTLIEKESVQINNREEIQKLEAAIRVNETILAMNKAYHKPKIGGILDIGSQGSVKDINAKNPFVLLGLSFDLPVYAGNRNNLKIKQQEMELASLNEQEKQIKNQLLLQTEMAKNSFIASTNSLFAKNTQVETAKRYYNDVLKRYKENQINYVELFEAQTQLTNSLLQKNIANYDNWIRFAELERAMASFELK